MFTPTVGERNEREISTTYGAVLHDIFVVDGHDPQALEQRVRLLHHFLKPLQVVNEVGGVEMRAIGGQLHSLERWEGGGGVRPEHILMSWELASMETILPERRTYTLNQTPWVNGSLHHLKPARQCPLKSFSVFTCALCFPTGTTHVVDSLLDAVADSHPYVMDTREVGHSILGE